MFRFFQILLMVTFPLLGYGQNIIWKQVAPLIPEGYDTLHGGLLLGDLNKDGRDDIVLALYPRSEKEPEYNEDIDRILLVILNGDGKLKKLGSSKNVLMCKGCGGMYGDPWGNISISKGVLTVSHYGGSAWRWTDQQKFRFQNNAMYLIGSTNDYYWINSDCDGKGIGNAGREFHDVNWVTGDEEVIKRDDNCKLITHSKKKIKVKPLIKLEQFNNE